MILVKTKISSSPIHGIGLYADQFIPKGTPTWRYTEAFDVSFTKDDVSKMSEPAQEQFWKYAYLDKELDRYVLCFDDQRFINHATENYNIQSTPREDTALRDIQPGEELLCNYDHYDDTYFNRRGMDPKDLL